MATTMIPRMVRAYMGREARAQPIHLSTRGMAGGHGHLGESRGGRLGGAFGVAPRESGDPVVNGNFERMPHTYLYGFPIAGGGLSERGKDQQATNGRLKAFSQAYLGALQGGATQQEAFRAAVRAQPQGLTDLMMHPTALQSMETLGQVLTGGSSGPRYTQVKGADGRVYNVPIDQETGQAGAAEAIPGLPGTQPKPEKPGRPFATNEGFGTVGPDGQFVPTLDAQGHRVMPAGKAGASTELAQSDIAGLPPQETNDVPKTAFNRQNYGILTSTPAVMAALQRMHDAATAMGPVKGPLAQMSGEYFGLNGTGAQFKADRDLIQSQAQKMAGSGYAAATKNFMEGIGTASNAPSFLRLQSQQMMQALRNQAQSLADEETASHHGKLPPALANQLIGVGVVPNGYQNQKTLDGMPSGAAALWKQRFFPQSLSVADKTQLLTDAAHGKFGSPGAANTNPDFQSVIRMREEYKAQQQAQQRQSAASQAATAVQPPASANPGQGTAGLGVQPAEGANTGAQQPGTASVQANQQGQGNPAQAPSQPQNLGQQQQQNQGPGQGASPQPGQPGQMETGNGLLMPPQAQPGQPAQGVPATNGTTPQAPANPLPAAPQTSQMLTPQGSVPTPASQGSLAATAPGAANATNIGALEVQAHQDAMAAQAQEEKENGGQPVAAPGAEGLALTPGM